MATPTENQDTVIDPLYLHSNDHPDLVLVTQTLNGDNYNSRYRSMCFALKGNNKFGYIDGSFVYPTEGYLKSQTVGKRNDNIMCSWLLNVVSKDIVTSIVYASSSLDIWTDLKNRLQQFNGPRIYQLRKDLYSLSKGNSSVTQYNTKLKSLWEELQDFKAECTYNCGGVKPLLAETKCEYVMLFLMGLSDGFSYVRGQILTMDLIPSITKVFSLVLQDEKHREIGAISKTTPPKSPLLSRHTRPRAPPKSAHLKRELW